MSLFAQKCQGYGFHVMCRVVTLNIEYTKSKYLQLFSDDLFSLCLLQGTPFIDAELRQGCTQVFTCSYSRSFTSTYSTLVLTV